MNTQAHHCFSHAKQHHPRIQLGFFFCALLAICISAGCESSSSSSSGANDLTQGGKHFSIDQFKAIKPGMTYDAVVKILGRRANLTVSLYGSPGSTTRKWMGSGPVWGATSTEVSVIFHEEIVTQLTLSNISLWYKVGTVLVTQDQIAVIEDDSTLATFTRN